MKLNLRSKGVTLTPKERKIYIPKMNHKWKSKSFDEFVKKQEHHLDDEDVA